MRFNHVGITAYGVALPTTCILGETIAQAQQKTTEGIARSLGVRQKSVPSLDEDTATLAVAAGYQALQRSGLSGTEIRALLIGSESHPYAVKPTGTIVKAALGLSDQIALADLQFACKAGTQGLQIVAAYVEAKLIANGLAIGADTAQGKPGDVLEYTAGAGAGAYILGSDNAIVNLHASLSVASDTPDFWRRPGQVYPEHGGRFSGEPGYFAHVMRATHELLEEMHLKPTDIDYCVFHTPNGKFPQTVASKLGFSPTQLQDSLVVSQIGNTYAGASLIALASLLDTAESGKTILLCSYGSGAGADAFLLETTERLVKQRADWSDFVRDQIEKLKPISYEEYRKATGSH